MTQICAGTARPCALRLSLSLASPLSTGKGRGRRTANAAAAQAQAKCGGEHNELQLGVSHGGAEVGHGARGALLRSAVHSLHSGGECQCQRVPESTG
jgi:hypothetical protein